MKIEHLAEHINDYKTSIESVIEKKILWETKTKAFLAKLLKRITKNYEIGWQVQELNWIETNEAVNITFDSFPPELIKKTNQIPSFQFIQGGTLVFSQSYSGDIYVFILYPIVPEIPPDKSSMELGVYSPKAINEKLVVEKVDEFLKEMIKWDLPTFRSKMGYQE
ncbi:hypothetical protein [Winogradskyella sp.]|uniref:hypothetical protein n=1 Tax=Winogradskyella sp. TaxID=1883156 RepID=UPI0025CE6560|nr:hypothetical protein [Winogradskyella sp.]